MDEDLNATIMDAYKRAIEHLEKAKVHIERAKRAGWEMADATNIAVESVIEQVTEDSP